MGTSIKDNPCRTRFGPWKNIGSC